MARSEALSCLATEICLSMSPIITSRGCRIDDAPLLSFQQRLLKRSFDVIFAVTGIAITGWIVAFAFIVASIDTRRSGFFLQERVGRRGKNFRIVKIRTMRESSDMTTTVTRSGDPRVTLTGRILRRLKIDELPQLFNVLLGEMSFVGPRPDVPGFADRLVGDQRMILAVRPGITGPATIEYRNEEAILARQDDPERYNREVIYPNKTRLNLEYVKNYSFAGDIQYIFRTIFPKKEVL